MGTYPVMVPGDGDNPEVDLFDMVISTMHPTDISRVLEDHTIAELLAGTVPGQPTPAEIEAAAVDGRYADWSGIE